MSARVLERACAHARVRASSSATVPTSTLPYLAMSSAESDARTMPTEGCSPNARSASDTKEGLTRRYLEARDMFDLKEEGRARTTSCMVSVLKRWIRVSVQSDARARCNTRSVTNGAEACKKRSPCKVSQGSSRDGRAACRAWSPKRPPTDRYAPTRDRESKHETKLNIPRSIPCRSIRTESDANKRRPIRGWARRPDKKR